MEITLNHELTSDVLASKPNSLTICYHFLCYFQALHKTLEFEDELAEKFGGGKTSSANKGIGIDYDENDNQKGENDNQPVLDIRKKYEKKFVMHNGSGNDSENENSGDLSVTAAGFNFHGIISSCFEPHLTVYVELEEKTLMENLEKLIQDETWETEEGSQTNVLSSSMQVFLIIRRSLKRCSALTKNKTLFNLFKVFQKILKAYATKLSSKLPKGGTGIVAAATGTDGQIKVSDRDERVVCYIVNTAEYCHKTDEFSAVITKSLMTLVQGLETKFEAEMAAMTRVAWGTIESVGDQSEYVNGINAILTTSIPVLGNLLSPIYFQFFLDKMLLDTQAVKTILLEIPALGKQSSGAPGYSTFVGREMSKAEALLKVILSPVESVADTYRALLPEGTPSDFQRILELKGLRRTDQQMILDDFNKRSSGIAQQPPPVPTAVLPTAPAVSVSPVTTAPTTTIAAREDVITRAAALGRGAATTGFKRFLALTEAAKDRKDGPFRKLFNQ
ncbi:unnamed protein product [Victoria cruziana]